MIDRKSKIYLTIVVILALVSSCFVYFISRKEVEELEVIQITPKKKPMWEVLKDLRAPQEKYPPKEILESLRAPQEKYPPKEILESLGAPR